MDTNNLATADDVAKLAGVSRWTVNRAFKKEASISEKTREKVLAAAEELGYAPDLLASSLASDRSHLVALLIDDFANPHKLIMLRSLTQTLRTHGWDTLLVNTLSEQDASKALLNVSQRRVDAAVLIGTNFDDHALETALGAKRVRKLILFARTSEYSNTVSICCNDEISMNSVADFVLNKGYKQALFLAGPQSPSAHLERKETFLKRWLQVRGYEASCIDIPAYDAKLAYLSISNYLDGMPIEQRPDVIVCENDALAMGTIDAIRYKHCLRVPEDIAVTGYDNVPQAAGPAYQLTTYQQPIEKMAEALVQVLKGKEDGPELQNFEGRLIIRTSA